MTGNSTYQVADGTTVEHLVLKLDADSGNTRVMQVVRDVGKPLGHKVSGRRRAQHHIWRHCSTHERVGSHCLDNGTKARAAFHAPSLCDVVTMVATPFIVDSVVVSV